MLEGGEEKVDRSGEVEDVESEARPKVMARKSPRGEDGAHPLENVGRGQTPRNCLGPGGKNVDRVEYRAEWGEHISDHPGDHLDPVAPDNDGARREEREGPTEDEQERGEGEEGPAELEDVQRIKDVDDEPAEANGYDEFAEAEKDQSCDPFRDLERRRKEIREIPMPKLLQQVRRDVDRPAPGDLPENKTCHQHQRQVVDRAMGLDPDGGESP